MEEQTSFSFLDNTDHEEILSYIGSNSLPREFDMEENELVYTCSEVLSTSTTYPPSSTLPTSSSLSPSPIEAINPNLSLRRSEFSHTKITKQFNKKKNLHVITTPSPTVDQEVESSKESYIRYISASPLLSSVSTVKPTSPSSLISPTAYSNLDENLSNEISNQTKIIKKKKNNSNNPNNNYLNARVYANNAPKIFLEILSAKTASMVIIMTYFFFFFCFILDFYITYEGIYSNNYNIPLIDCESFLSDQNTLDPWREKLASKDDLTSNYYGCSNGTKWYSIVENLNNVLSYKLVVNQKNLTAILPSASIQSLNIPISFPSSSLSPIIFSSNSNYIAKFQYQINVWGCGSYSGCGSSFNMNNNLLEINSDSWQKVLELQEQEGEVDLSPYYTMAQEIQKLNSQTMLNNEVKNNKHSQVSSYLSTLLNPLSSSLSSSNQDLDSVTISYELISNTFQNQESLPTKGYIQSYLFEVEIFNNPYGLFTFINDPSSFPTVAPTSFPSSISTSDIDVTYSINIFTRPQTLVYDVLSLFLFFLTLFFLFFYVKILLTNIKQQSNTSNSLYNTSVGNTATSSIPEETQRISEEKSAVYTSNSTSVNGSSSSVYITSTNTKVSQPSSEVESSQQNLVSNSNTNSTLFPVKILSEQYWIILYLCFILLYQNPFYFLIIFNKSLYYNNFLVFFYYISYYFSQCGIFLLWIFFSDSVNRKNKTFGVFYSKKIGIIALLFVLFLFLLFFSFSSLFFNFWNGVFHYYNVDDDTNHNEEIYPLGSDSSGKIFSFLGEFFSDSDSSENSTSSFFYDYSSLLSITNWPTDKKILYIVLLFFLLFFIFSWVVWWFYCLYLSHKELKLLPYMSTRYLQLSYRFFLLQATLVTFYYFFQYGSVFYFISFGPNSVINTDSGYSDSLSHILNNINITIKQQTQLFGKTLFLTIYSFLLALLFLPANFLSQFDLLNDFSLLLLDKTFVITEKEYKNLVKMKKKIFYNQSLTNFHFQSSKNFSALIHSIFCIDIAIIMRNISSQTYYDPIGIKTLSGYGSNIDLLSYGYEIIDYFYDTSHETFCIISRNKEKNHLVVSFRGTASKRQMEDNLNYKKIEVDFMKLSLKDLDKEDGLDYYEKKHRKGLRRKKSISEKNRKRSNSQDRLMIADLESLKSLSDDEDYFTEDFFNHDEEMGSTLDDDIFSSSSSPIRHSSSNVNNNSCLGFIDKKHQKSDIAHIFHDAVETTNQGINRMVEATTGLMVSAASNTPGLEKILKPYVHTGFWSAYLTQRDFTHRILRKELKDNPCQVYFTGHSLGGAMATFAAMDFTLHTLPRLNKYLKQKTMEELKNKKLNFKENSSLLSSNNTSTHSNSTILHDYTPVYLKKIKVFVYSYGSPRIGNHAFTPLYNKIVPNSFRVVVDGDLVVGLPPSGYGHVGTEILIDSLGTGSIIIDPSFVERWLRTNLKSSISAHSLLSYRKGLLGIKYSSEYMKQYFKTTGKCLDPLRVALEMRNNYKIEKIVAEKNDEEEFFETTNSSMQNFHTEISTIRSLPSYNPFLPASNFVSASSSSFFTGNSNEIEMTSIKTQSDIKKKKISTSFLTSDFLFSLTEEDKIQPKESILIENETINNNSTVVSPLFQTNITTSYSSSSFPSTTSNSKQIFLDSTSSYLSDPVSSPTSHQDLLHYRKDVQNTRELFAQVKELDNIPKKLKKELQKTDTSSPRNLNGVYNTKTSDSRIPMRFKKFTSRRGNTGSNVYYQPL